MISVALSDLISRLKAVAEAWLDRQNHWRQEAILSAASEFCLSSASFNWTLDWIFEQWTNDNILKMAGQNPFKKRKYAVQVLAGNTPAMIAQGLLQSAILGIPQCIKVPRRQSRFAKLLHRSLVENAVYSENLVTCDTWENNLTAFYEELKRADAVLMYGHDETLAVLKSYINPQAQWVARGHAESIAVIFKEATHPLFLTQLAEDMLSYDQRGCLSPRVTVVEEGGDLTPFDCAKLFADTILPPLANRFPSGGLFPGEDSEILHQRNLYRFRGSVFCGQDWTVCYDQKSTWPTVSLPRFMIFKSFKNVEALATILTPIKTQLITIGCAGPKENLAPLNLSLRVSDLGAMQKQLLMF